MLEYFLFKLGGVPRYMEVQKQLEIYFYEWRVNGRSRNPLGKQL
jgi:hypothetical protein